MNINLLCENPDADLFTRLLQIRNISENLEDFLEPSYTNYRQDPFLLNDMDKAVDRIHTAITNNEKIMIFGDYDVDGITSSYIVYTFFTQFLWYKHISVRLPHRTKDGYGIKSHHIDDIHEQWCTLIITVDNGITSVDEVAYATTLGIDTVITDHHQALDRVPEPIACVNPQISTNMKFKEICWASVAFKLCLAVAKNEHIERSLIKRLYDRMLPFVSIATIADCMPLIDENRLLVSKWFRLINNKRHTIAPSLKQFLEYLNIKDIDSHHVWFMIWPRLNATWRIDDAMEWLMSLLISHPEKQRKQLEKIEELNNERRKMQQQMTAVANTLINPDNVLLVATSEDFHEWVVWIVAGRITDKHNKPSLILRVDTYKKTATWSLRWPDRFNIVDMLKSADDLLLRYGGHACAWWMTVDLDVLDEALARFDKYCSTYTPISQDEKPLHVDTLLHSHELDTSIMNQLLKFWPFGQGNPEPVFQINDVVVTHTETVGRGERTHLKLHCKKDERTFHIMQRWQGELAGQITTNIPHTIIGKIRPDTFNGGFYVDGKLV